MIYVLNAAYLFMLVGLAVRDVLALRLVLVTAQTIFIVYGSITGNYVMLVWNCLFFAINAFQAIVLIRRRRPVQIPADLVDLYERVFDAMSRREFLSFWNIGTTRRHDPGTIVHHGHPQREVMLILEGTAAVILAGKQIAELGRGSFIAEMSFLTGHPASADVVCREPVTTITWTQENLRSLRTLDHDLRIKVRDVLSRDVVEKAKQTAKLLV